MKKTLMTILVVATLFFSACGSKTPFSLEKPLPNSALLYIYFPQHIAIDEDSHESSYNIFFNGKRVMETIYVNEYMVFNVKPEKVKITLTRKQIEEKSVTVNLKSGNTYYFKIKDNMQDNMFDFIQVNKNVGLSEIAKTGKAGTLANDKEYLVDVFTTPESEVTQVAPVIVHTKSKTDELLNAAKLKEQGLLTNEEFNKLKSEILAR